MLYKQPAQTPFCFIIKPRTRPSPSTKPLSSIPVLKNIKTNIWFSLSLMQRKLKLKSISKSHNNAIQLKLLRIYVTQADRRTFKLGLFQVRGDGRVIIFLHSRSVLNNNTIWLSDKWSLVTIHMNTKTVHFKKFYRINGTEGGYNKRSLFHFQTPTLIRSMTRSIYH